MIPAGPTLSVRWSGIGRIAERMTLASLLVSCGGGSPPSTPSSPSPTTGSLSCPLFCSAPPPHATPSTQCFPNLEAPHLQVLARDASGHYPLRVTNWSVYPDAMFEPSPTLPPCGGNLNSARTWIEIYEGTGRRLYGYCGLAAACEMCSAMWALWNSSQAPAGIYIIMFDRRCGLAYTSNVAFPP